WQTFDERRRSEHRRAHAAQGFEWADDRRSRQRVARHNTLEEPCWADCATSTFGTSSGWTGVALPKLLKGVLFGGGAQAGEIRFYVREGQFLCGRRKRVKAWVCCDGIPCRLTMMGRGLQGRLRHPTSPTFVLATWPSLFVRSSRFQDQRRELGLEPSTNRADRRTKADSQRTCFESAPKARSCPRQPSAFPRCFA